MIRNKKALLIAVLGAAAITAPTLSVAQQSRDRGGYFGLSAGHADYKESCKDLTIPCDNSDTAWRFFGGYQFSRTLALEFGYADLGAVSASGTAAGVPVSARAEANAWDLTGVLSFPMSPQFAFFGKLGIYRADLDSRGNAPGLSFNADEKNTGFLLGAGAQYMFGRTLGVRAEWNQYGNVGGPSTGEDDISTFTAGVIWKFQ